MSHTSEPTGARRTLERIRRHWRWGRQQGFGRLIEEDQLNPVTRLRLASSKRRWRRQHHVAPNAVPVYLIGLQRSGTNMVARGLEEAPEFEVRNENDRAAFERFQLRPDPVIRDLVARSGPRFVQGARELCVAIDDARRGLPQPRFGLAGPARGASGAR